MNFQDPVNPDEGIGHSFLPRQLQLVGQGWGLEHLGGPWVHTVVPVMPGPWPASPEMPALFFFPSLLQLCFPTSRTPFCPFRHMCSQPSVPRLEACSLLRPDRLLATFCPICSCLILYMCVHVCLFFFLLEPFGSKLLTFWSFTLKSFLTLCFFIVRFGKLWFVSSKIPPV